MQTLSLRPLLHSNLNLAHPRLPACFAASCTQRGRKRVLSGSLKPALPADSKHNPTLRIGNGHDGIVERRRIWAMPSERFSAPVLCVRAPRLRFCSRRGSSRPSRRLQRLSRLQRPQFLRFRDCSSFFSFSSGHGEPGPLLRYSLSDRNVERASLSRPLRPSFSVLSAFARSCWFSAP